MSLDGEETARATDTCDPLYTVRQQLERTNRHLQFYFIALLGLAAILIANQPHWILMVFVLLAFPALTHIYLERLMHLCDQTREKESPTKR